MKKISNCGSLEATVELTDNQTLALTKLLHTATVAVIVGQYDCRQMYQYIEANDIGHLLYELNTGKTFNDFIDQ
jgi:hypothetical protein